MTLLDILNSDLKEAMKEKNSFALGVIRMAKGAIQLEAINKKYPSQKFFSYFLKTFFDAPVCYLYVLFLVKCLFIFFVPVLIRLSAVLLLSLESSFLYSK